jgi:hypothetical protein
MVPNYVEGGGISLVGQCSLLFDSPDTVVDGLSLFRPSRFARYTLYFVLLDSPSDTVA